ncbi:MAG: hypothetical protein JNN04_03430 [Cyclobacteriaceae bacterium]|nr:hypothetical protein [Cyclobacteriaceae bacterium]
MNSISSLLTSRHRNLYLFFIILFLVVFLGALVSYAIYPAPVFTWQQLQELQPQELPLYAFERGNLEFTIAGENYILFERWMGNPIQPHLLALDVYFLFFGISLAALLALISTLPRFSFYFGALITAFLLALMQWETIRLLGSDSGYVGLLIIGLVMALLFAFQYYRTDASYLHRFLAFLGLAGGIALVAVSTSTVEHPLRLLAANSLNPALVIALAFIILVAHQLMASFVSLATASSKTHAFKQYLILAAIYLLNLWLAYWNRIGWMEWDYTLPSFALLAISAALTVWTIRQRMPIYEQVFPDEGLLTIFILSFSTLALATYGYFLSAANDIALLSLNDLILYTHLAFGMMFLVYVIANFLGVFEQRLPVDKVLYKPPYMPYFTFRFAGIIVTLAFIFYGNWLSHVNHFTSAYYTALGDVYFDQPTGKAHTFYKRAHFYASYNQYASTVLADLEAAAQNYGKQKNYSVDANGFQPTEFTFLNTDQVHLMAGNAYAEIRLLRQAKSRFPSSGVINNNLGLALARVNMNDSAAYYFTQAQRDRRTKNSAILNLLALQAKSMKAWDADSIEQAVSGAPTAVRSNALAIINHQGKVSSSSVLLPQDSVFDLFSATLVTNFLTNKTNLADSTFVSASVQMARRPENISYRHMILPAAAKACYAAGQVNRAFQLLQEAVFLGGNEAAHNYTLGLLAMDQEKYEVATSYFLYAIHHNSKPAAMANAVALAEAGRINEAIIAWDTLSRADDSTHYELAESMKRVLAVPQEWFDDLSETEKLYYSLYRIPLSDSILFERLVRRISNEDLRAKAYLNRSRQFYRMDEAALAARQYQHLTGLHLTDTELFAEIKYFELRLLAEEGRLDELQKIIDQGILFGPYRESERIYYEALQRWKAGDKTAAGERLNWLARHNWYFDEGVVAAAAFHGEDLKAAYGILSEALQVNPRSARLLKAYIPVALARGFDQYAADALETLRTVLPPASFRKYVAENQLAGLIQ